MQTTLFSWPVCKYVETNLLNADNIVHIEGTSESGEPRKKEINVIYRPTAKLGP